MAGYEIIVTPEKGRAMFATRDYKSDETIFEEKPFVSCQFSWNKTYKYLACDHCLRPLETAEQNVQRLTGDKSITLPFPQCCPTTANANNHTKCSHCGTNYCSEECRIDAAQQHHFSLCTSLAHTNIDHPINSLVDSWKKIHYPPETTTISLIVRLLGMYTQAVDKTTFMSNLSDFQDKVINEDLLIAHKMLGPNFEQQLSTLYPHYCKAFAGAPDMTQFLTPEAFKTFFAIIGTNGQGIGTSSFADWVKNVSELKLPEDEQTAVDTLIDDLYERLDEVTGLQFLNNEGSALFLTQSKINHSCVPNATPTFPCSNHTVVVKTTKDIQKGEEICISYLDECSLERGRHSRQKELKDNYLFVCHCKKCEEQINDPDVTSEEDSDDSDMDQ